jgi:hypothetical protein
VRFINAGARNVAPSAPNSLSDKLSVINDVRLVNVGARAVAPSAQKSKHIHSKQAPAVVRGPRFVSASECRTSNT